MRSQANRNTKTEIEMRHMYADRLSVKKTGGGKRKRCIAMQVLHHVIYFVALTVSHHPCRMISHYACHMTLAAVAFLAAV